VLAQAPDGSAVDRYDATPPMPGATGDVEALALYAGQSAAIIEDMRPAAAIVDQLVIDAAARLATVAPATGMRRPSAA
jgi:hypothetical protein